jgi:uncharacterized protein (TIGR00730 family)
MSNVISESGVIHPATNGQEAAADRRFLQGPQSRLKEFGRAVRIFGECIKGFRRLHFVGPCATVFGSARFGEDHPYYKMARDLGAQLAHAGFTVMTGGGPGIMEAANRGARDVKGRSVGCNIVLPKEQFPNPYLDEFVEFRYFFIRKLMLAKYSYAFIAMPGGFGTLDELFEIATLIQTEKVKEFPIVLMGKDFWAPLIEFLKDPMLSDGTISPEDVDRFIISDSPAEVAARCREIGMTQFGLTHGPKKPRWWFLEK